MQGNQTKLDKNENSKIDSQDFKMLRGESKEAGIGSKPSLKAKFEAAMQKQYKSRPENKMKLMEKKSPKLSAMMSKKSM